MGKQTRTCSLILLLLLLTFGFAGCGLIPGVDIPIDHAAFWNPDIPDYADDGNPYSLTMLGSGTVFDHTRYLKMVNIVENLYTQILNQQLNLQKLGTSLNGVNERYNQLKQMEEQTQGAMNKNKNWDQTYLSIPSLESGKYKPELNEIEELIKRNDKTYKDALRQSIVGNQNPYIESMINQVTQQNLSITGNNQGKENNNQNYAIKNIQGIEHNQIYGYLISTYITNMQMKEQENAQAYQNAKEIHVNVSDPYHPQSNEPVRKKGNGFLKF